MPHTLLFLALVTQPTLELPWACGDTYMCTQGHNGGSHVNDGAWAWDFGMSEGLDVWAAAEGSVSHVRMDSNVGGCSASYASDANYVVVDHGDGTATHYMHLQQWSSSLSVGDWVDTGDLVGRIGLTGWVCGAHLHFQVQSSCGSYWCTSMPAQFHDYGDPAYGDWLTSGNCPQSQPTDGDGDGWAEVDDCNDGDPTVYPGAPEVCDDGVDQDCDGSDWTSDSYYEDGDGDGYGAAVIWSCGTPPADAVGVGGDCDDGNADAFPGAPEVCDDGVDQDCDGADATSTLYYEDGDGDGYGDAPISVCGSPPADAVGVGGDCDDGNPDVYPGAPDLCDGVLDNDCDGATDPMEADADGDGVSICDGDCDDSDPDLFPGNPEVCDHEDQDCDDLADEGLPMDVYFTDADGDGYGDPDLPVIDCGVFAGTVDNELDCDDSDPSQNPDGVEVCNYEDDDCDGTVDEGVRPTLYLDADQDSWGDVTTWTVDYCCEDDANAGEAEGPWLEVDGDCDDDNPAIHPDAAETCDGVDEDCDGTADEGVCGSDDPNDGDGDGVTETGGDCDDADWNTYPGAPEICDGADNDCDPSTPVDDGCDEGDDDTEGDDDDIDLDEDGFTPAGGDCDDLDPGVHPEALEVPLDHVDNDCDGVVDEPVPVGCGCGTRGRGSPQLAALALLAMMALRRRR